VRKETLVEYGFRLPSAKDNRPLRFAELEEKMRNVIFVSATPSKYEAAHSTQIVEQIIRPTGLVDPEIIIKPITPSRAGAIGKHDLSQVDDCINRIIEVTKRGDRVLVTTLTKKMAEDLNEYLTEKKIKARYLHSDIDTIERLEILSEFRKGTYEVIVGVNLLREGLDLPEVALVCILDADKEGFLRSDVALIQTIGRAARNVRGQVVLYADHITGSMKRAIDETDRRRNKQIAYNKEHGITPQTIIKAIKDIRGTLGLSLNKKDVKDILKLELTAETHDLKTVLKQKDEEMKEAAKNLQFELAAILRDEVSELLKEIKKREKTGSALPEASEKKITKRAKPRHGKTR